MICPSLAGMKYTLYIRRHDAAKYRITEERAI